MKTRWASNPLGNVPRILIICWNIVFVWYIRYRADVWENHSKTLSGKSLYLESFPVKYAFRCLFSSKHSLVDDCCGPILNGFFQLIMKTESKGTRIPKHWTCLPMLRDFYLRQMETTCGKWKLQNLFLSVTDRQDTYSLGINPGEDWRKFIKIAAKWFRSQKNILAKLNYFYFSWKLNSSAHLVKCRFLIKL